MKRGAVFPAASWLRLLGVALVCAKVALLPVVFDYSLDAPFTVAKTLLSHGLAYALAAVMVGLLLGFGRSFFVWSPIHLPVLLFCAANIAAAMFAANVTLALFGAHGRMLGLATLADLVVLYFAVVLLVRTRTEAIAVVTCALLASFVVLTYELVQVLGHDPLSWSTDVTTRPISTIGQATSLAEYLTILAVGAVGLAVVVERLPGWVRLVLLVSAALLFVGAGATGTRSAVFGIAAGTSLLLIAVWLRYRSMRARMLSVVAVGAGTAVLAALVIASPLGARFAAVVSLDPNAPEEDLAARLEPATETRAALYDIAVAMVQDRPILGYGPDNFSVGVARFRSEHEPPEIRQSLATSAHSWVAHAATSSGLIGLSALIGVAVVAMRLALRRKTPALAVVGAAMLAAYLGTGLTTINDISTDWLLWASVGMVAAATARPVNGWSEQPGELPRVKHSRKSAYAKRTGWDIRRFAMLACLAAAIALPLTTLNPWEASRSIRSSRQARLENRSAEAIQHALRATQLDQGRAEYWNALGLAYISAARWAEASSAFDRATRLAPYDARNIGDHARAQLLLSGAATGAAATAARSKAIELGDLAVSTDPNNPRAQLTKALVMQVTGNRSEALRSVERALELDPRSVNGPLYVTAAQVLIESGRASDAIRIAREGVGLLGASVATVPLRYELARALVATNQAAAALVEIETALSIQPGYAPAERLRSEIRATLNR
jgi:O-antigen ligase/tetratricopeptide (TPR) repeat protein